MNVAQTMVWLAHRKAARRAAIAAPWHDPEPRPADPFPLQPPRTPEPGFTVSLPVDGVLTSGFGTRMHPLLHVRRFHRGVDIAARRGAPVWAMAAGTVAIVAVRSGYGLVVILDHGAGITTLYGHLDRAYVHAGERVGGGTIIGAVGVSGLASGPHVHFERRVHGRPVDPGIE